MGFWDSKSSEIIQTRSQLQDLISAKTWTILLVTLLGFVGAMTPIAKIRSDSIIASIFLYFLAALIASGSSFKGFSQALIYI
ncbi:hypothetical protein M973_05990 [Francisella orientalis LADL 07-285A]|nr:hypothetical protein M973_05990 [Francisella orientalis LADL 07-285A]